MHCCNSDTAALCYYKSVLCWYYVAMSTSCTKWMCKYGVALVSVVTSFEVKNDCTSALSIL